MTYSPRGSLWHRWDLHFHTPSSFDYENKGVTDEQIVAAIKTAGIRVVAVTDHHVIDVARLKRLQLLAADSITFLPGIELRDDHGDKPVHYISIFPEDCDLEHVWTTLQGKLGLTAASVAAKGGDQKVYVPIEDGARTTRELGGIISIHAGAKANSIEGIKNVEQFQQRIKFDITKQFVDVMEIGQLKDVDSHLKTIFPKTGLYKPLVLCSDNHNALQYSCKAPLWIRGDPNFRGLLMVLREPGSRVCIGGPPPELVRVDQNPTKQIRSVSFRSRSETGPRWFHGNVVQFNPGLVAVVGNKGSGKSALADTLGLLGATRNSHDFSFLNTGRFRHPTGGHANAFEATIEWESGESITKGLADPVKPDEVERLKYLPQGHVETVCNELATLGETGFEQELKSVIFSHVPHEGRLGQASLDDLVSFQTSEKQKRIDSLLTQLRESSRQRAHLEEQANPVTKKEWLARIERRASELAAHDAIKPTEVMNPAASEGGVTLDPAVAAALQDAETARSKLHADVQDTERRLAASERRHAVAQRLVERLNNFKKDVEVFTKSLVEDATELALTAGDLVSVTIATEKPAEILAAALAAATIDKERLAKAGPLRAALQAATAKIAELQSSMDAPSRAYQAYQTTLSEWAAKRAVIVGTEGDPESLTGLQSRVEALDSLPEKIEAARQEQVRLGLEIHAEKVAQATVFRTLYAPVQEFLLGQSIARDKLKVEFRAELTNEGFSDQLLGLLARNRRGSFMGVDEGRSRADSFVTATAWSDAESVRHFLVSVDDALHRDDRDEAHPPVQLRDQLAKGKKPEDVFNALFGLEYVRPRYILRWDGKDLAMLSPGERGTLLLVFYLLVDLSDVPLVIDQPEGNLDNFTVAKVLVDCIKEARKRRQVIIVTHNPNLAVVCDADQVIHADMDRTNGVAITYSSGSLENPTVGLHVTNVLEGTLSAFNVRGAKYEVVT